VKVAVAAATTVVLFLHWGTVFCDISEKFTGTVYLKSVSNSLMTIAK